MKARGIGWFLALPYKATFWPPLIYVRRAAVVTSQWASKRAWMFAQSRRGCDVHGSIEIRGAKHLHDRAKLGGGCVFERECTLWLSDDAGHNCHLEMGNHVFVGRNAYLGVYQPLRVGSNTLIGAYSYIITANHGFRDPRVPVRLQGYTGAPIVIGEDVWIGCHVVVLPGATIGDRAVIAAHAVVTKPVPAGEIWGGVPARKLGVRDSSGSG